jgi:osmotically inducible lipoprotein OsmB
MKTFLTLLLLTAVSIFSSCSTGPHATTGTAVGAVGGAVVAGPAGAVVGGTVGNAYGHEDDKR